MDYDKQRTFSVLHITFNGCLFICESINIFIIIKSNMIFKLIDV